MFRRAIAKYGLAFHLAILAAAPVALTPFLPGTAIAVILIWLCTITAIWFFSEPSIRPGEHLAETRLRVAHTVIRDPVFWFFVVVLFFTGIRMFNDGVSFGYQPETASWQLIPPKMSVMPACVAGAGFYPFVLAFSAMIVTIALRNAVGRKARVLFALMASAVSGIGGLSAALCTVFKIPFFYELARTQFSSAPFFGSLFGAWLLVGIFAGTLSEVYGWSVSRFCFFIAIAGNLAGLFYFEPPIVFVGYAVAVLLSIVFSFTFVSRVCSMSALARITVFLVFGIAAVVGLWFAWTPPALVAEKMKGFAFATQFGENYQQFSDVLNRFAKTIWEKSPWLGSGLGSFPIEVKFLATAEDWDILTDTPRCVFNGWWLLLSERGILGVIIVAIGFGLLLWEYSSRLVGGIKYVKDDEESPVFFLAISPLVWVAPVVVLLVCAEAVFFSVFAFDAVWVNLCSIAALAIASFPRYRNSST